MIDRADAEPPLYHTLTMLAAVGTLYLIMMGSTFFSLGVVLPFMAASLHMGWLQAGFGFTLLALAAGLSSMLPSVVIRRRGARFCLGVGAVVMMLAYAAMAVSRSVAGYDAGAALLGLGFSLVGAVPALHILGGWAGRRRALLFGAYLALGGVGGAAWPTLVHSVIAAFGGWRGYWWFMVALMSVAGLASVAVLREAPGEAGPSGEQSGRTLAEALRTPEFAIIGCAIASTYLVASTVNAFTVSYLGLIGVGTAWALAAFSVQSACHAAFPLLMGGLASRIGVRALLATGLALQAAGMLGLASAGSRVGLAVFAIGVGGGYGTVFLATTLSLEAYFGRRDFPRIFGANQLFTTISVVGPTIIGRLADVTGRFDLSFVSCAMLLLAAMAAVLSLRDPATSRASGQPAAHVI